MKLIPKYSRVLPDKMSLELYYDPSGTMYGLMQNYVDSHQDEFVTTVVNWTFDESAIVPNVLNSPSVVVLIRLPDCNGKYNGFWVRPNDIKDI